MAATTTALVVAGIGLAVTAAGTAVQFSGQRKAARADKKIAKERERAEALERRRQRRRVIREARITRGQQLNVAGQVGAGESSGSSGGLTATASQAGFNLGVTTQSEGISGRISKFGRQRARGVNRAAIGGGIASIGGAIFNNSNLIGGFLSGGGDDSNPTAAPGLSGPIAGNP